MPTYEYLCQACEHEFEEFQSITANPLRKCPKCGKLKLKRLIGIGAGIIFKGSGFYETDYRSDSYKSAAKADRDSGTSTSSTSSTASTTAKSDSASTATKSDGAAKTDSGSAAKSGGGAKKKSATKA